MKIVREVDWGKADRKRQMKNERSITQTKKALKKQRALHQEGGNLELKAYSGSLANGNRC